MSLTLSAPHESLRNNIKIDTPDFFNVISK